MTALAREMRFEEAARMRDRIDIVRNTLVITSYSIHYTKLYDIAVVDGGAERQDSVRNALTVVPEEAEIILVHDAVRPFVSVITSYSIHYTKLYENVDTAL